MYDSYIIRILNDNKSNDESLMDNFEWSRGYSERFGLHWVNFTDPARPVYTKKSAEWFSHVAASNSIFPKNSLRDEF